ncbi:hypothetical protein V9K81_08640 [Pseudomonas monteilii]|uniref:hypothetical protein n=1 Tax=Pseudomonas monteilii TaxID=76759 RepID=UPI0030D39F50
MERFTNSLRSSVDHEDWYVALAAALALPDICGALITPNAGNKARYTAWFDVWMAHHYTFNLPAIGPHCMLTGDECYQLRCSYLHAGQDDIAGRGSRKILDRFRFVEPLPNLHIHCNQSGGTLQLQVDEFCYEMLNAVDNWAYNVAEDAEIQARMRELLLIHKLDPCNISI